MSHSAEDLTAALRALIDVVRTADFDGVDLETQVGEVRDLTARLEPHRVEGVRMQAGLYFENGGPGQGGPEMLGDPDVYFPYSPVIGRLNPISPPMQLRRVEAGDSSEIHGDATFGAAYNGPPGCVHGGVLALAFDELLGCVCVSNGLGGFTGTLTVVYRNTTPLEAPVRLRGWHERSEGRKTFVKGTLHHGDTLCAEAEGIFIRSELLDSGLSAG